MPFSTDGLMPLHHRRYDAHAYKVSPTRIRIVGEVVDTKPPGMYVPGDPEPLVIHHMRVAIDVDVTTMTIVDAQTAFEMNPYVTCPDIIEHYDRLIGLSITRGFNRQLRELFGGPRACTHTTALIQAMAPVVIQTMWTLRMSNRGASDGEAGDGRAGDGEAGGAAEAGADGGAIDPEVTLRANMNTCHIWAEDGAVVADVRAGVPGPVPVWIERRYRELGLDLAEWNSPVS